MATNGDLVAAIETIHAAGLDTAQWSPALAAVTQLCGGCGTTLEVFDTSAQRHARFHAFGIPSADETAYLNEYFSLSPRVPHLMRQQHSGDVGWDGLIFDDEAALARDPFYAEFLARIGLRYFISGVLIKTRGQFGVVAVQRSPKQGHVGRSEIKRMRLLVPHLQQALDVAARLEQTADGHASFEHALDWLSDGVAMIGGDGAVTYANEALQTMIRRGDGIRIAKGMITFAAPDAAARLREALGGVGGLHDGKLGQPQVSDFAAPRPSGAPRYVVSVRPLFGNGAGRRAIVFIRDPLRRHDVAIGMLRELFGLTEAEAGLAQAMQAGVPLGEYARTRAVSLNTVYTHLRRIKEKTGCKRLPELIGKLNDLQVPLRLD
jgi:DNA-binding CsgD family transcriptional regulator